MRLVGILGTGAMGRTHARHYSKMSDVQIVFYEQDPDKATAYQKEFNATPIDSAEKLIEIADIVDICLPTHLHFEFAVKAINDRKPVLCEKPMCRTVGECAELTELIIKTGVPFMPAQVVRFFPEFKTAREAILKGEVGDVATVRTRRGGGFPKGSHNWFADSNLSGGVILDLAIHDIDWIRWTFGEVERVFCQSLSASESIDKGYALLTLTLESGVIAHVEATWADPGGFRVTFEVSGADGFIEYDSRQSPALRTHSDRIVNENPLDFVEDPYYSEIMAFLKAVETNSTPPVTALDGLKAVAICEAAIESAATGRPVAMA